MRKVIVHPERCVGCMQCMHACATVHSKSKDLFAAAMESPLPKARIHVGVGLFNEGFPNRCRHCEPAPCQLACLPGAISRDVETDTVLIDPDLCINCASCAMACPFGVIRYHEHCHAPPGKVVAVKCDNCFERQMQGLIPACVEVCKAHALTFEDPSQALKRKTDEVARSVSPGVLQTDLAAGFSVLNAHKRQQIEIALRRS